MDREKIAKALVKIAKELIAADTYKCPECGTKVLEQTGYCVKCKKKVKKAKDDKVASLDPTEQRGNRKIKTIASKRFGTMKYTLETWKDESNVTYFVIALRDDSIAWGYDLRKVKKAFDSINPEHPLGKVYEVLEDSGLKMTIL